ncbi:MAG TPA: hypothetical protein VFT19_01325 [Solirubrobacterales bacterium]|nr:hypothetical protein [Solirubrobacterales bacterium]
MPSSTASPARWASIASGRTPAPTTTASHSIALPPLVSTALTRPSPSKASSSSPPWKVTPCSSSLAWNQRPASSPKVRESATSSIVTIVHSTPIAVSEAATSQPM